MILAILFLGLAGTEIELLLLEHYEDAWQFVPLVLIALGALVLARHAARPRPSSLRAMRATMVAFILAGGLGVVLHFRANVEFQRELDPEQSRTAVVWKSLRAKAPPALAPGVMVQLGLLGLVYGYRDPAGIATSETRERFRRTP